MSGSARSHFYLVDGHSVLHAWPDFHRLHLQRPRQAREQLIRWLTSFQDAGHGRVVVVFDGSGPKTAAENTHPADIQVVYAGGGASADSVIERLVAAHAGHHELTVVTADMEERAAVTALGAWWCDPDDFRSRGERTRAEQQRSFPPRAGGGFRLGDSGQFG